MSDGVKFERSKVVQIVQSVITKMEGLSGDSLSTLRQELVALETAIEKTRHEIADTGTPISSTQARDELDAVVAATREATDDIMNACETLQALSADLDADAQAAIQAQVTRIYEACSFQDITGQRITKVINLLHVVENKVGHMLQTLVHEGGDANTPVVQADADAALMNGPQLAGNALSQDDIDKLLASFD